MRKESFDNIALEFQCNRHGHFYVLGERGLTDDRLALALSNLPPKARVKGRESVMCNWNSFLSI
jgi:hypothetical protein